jgi:hypothetical protein
VEVVKMMLVGPIYKDDQEIAKVITGHACEVVLEAI